MLLATGTFAGDSVAADQLTGTLASESAGTVGVPGALIVPAVALPAPVPAELKKANAVAVAIRRAASGASRRRRRR
jgi:hypothetical protein